MSVSHAAPLTINSPAQVIVSSLRRAWAAKNYVLLCPGGEETALKSMTKFVEALSITQPLAKAHVFDMQHLASENEDGLLLSGFNKALEQGLGPPPPFPNTIFLHRDNTVNAQTQPTLRLYLVQQEKDQIVVDYFLNGKQWAWALRVTMSWRVAQKEYNAFAYGKHVKIRQGESVIDNATVDIILGIGLLACKGDMVLVEPAVSVFVGEPPKSGYAKPNPSISIVKVCTPRSIMLADSEPTGASVRPHDRRSHLRRVGNRLIIVRDSKINGGASSPTAKIINLARCVT